MTKMTMEISGMTCGHCIGGVSKALQSVAGVEIEQVKVGSAVVNYDASAVTPTQIAQAIKDEGYGVVGMR